MSLLKSPFGRVALQLLSSIMRYVSVKICAVPWWTARHPRATYSRCYALLDVAHQAQPPVKACPSPGTGSMSQPLIQTLARLTVGIVVIFGLVPLRSDQLHVLSRMRGIPRLMLWAWEEPEDLRFINADDVGVAFLAKTIRLNGHNVFMRPRLQPLLVPDNAKLVAVARIEAEPDAALDSAQREASVKEIVAVSSAPRVVAVQVDFDATKSQQGFYRDLLVRLRSVLPPRMPISITALASWCIGDDWISGLPVDEAVPMLFRLGTGTNEVATLLQSAHDFRDPLCRDSLGISTDERWRKLPSGRRLYVFRPRPWTEQAQSALFWELHR